MNVWMMALFVGWCVYPVLAGLVYRRISGGARLCGGKNEDALGRTRCWGMGDPYGSCADCRRVRWAAVAAWLWPLAWILWVPYRLFWLSGDVSVTGTRPAPEQPKRGARNA